MNFNFKFLNNLNLYKFLLNLPTGDFATEAKIVCNYCCIPVSCTIYSSFDLKVLYITKTRRNAI